MVGRHQHAGRLPSAQGAVDGIAARGLAIRSAGHLKLPDPPCLEIILPAGVVINVEAVAKLTQSGRIEGVV